METLGNQKNEKNECFFCEPCQYKCRYISDWNRHLTRAKHLNNVDKIQNDTIKNIENIDNNKYIPTALLLTGLVFSVVLIFFNLINNSF